ncbi:hypothetical protein [Antarctobacter jejuensis]|uniref:hypothetical protein n=1 Tax=Antarctobacter jejuensis TaxID=1439938 RepID=UPI003FD5DD75
MKALAAALVLTAAPLAAQELPAFDETLGYDVHGTVDDGLLLTNGGTLFYCEVDEGPGDRYLVMTQCLPILGPKEAKDVERAAAGAAASAEAFATSVSKLPPVALMGAVGRTLRAFDCTLSKDDDQTEIQTVLAREAAKDAGYTGPLTEDVLDAVGDRGEKALELMIDNGQIEIDPADKRRVRLVGCP